MKTAIKRSYIIFPLPLGEGAAPKVPKGEGYSPSLADSVLHSGRVIECGFNSRQADDLFELINLQLV